MEGESWRREMGVEEERNGGEQQQNEEAQKNSEPATKKDCSEGGWGVDSADRLWEWYRVQWPEVLRYRAGGIFDSDVSRPLKTYPTLPHP
jgi:hypothetical protein